MITLGRVYVWTSPKEAYNPECLVPAVKHGNRCVIILAAVSRILLVLYSFELLPVTVDILDSQVHPVVQVLFPNNDAIFPDNMLIHSARSVQSWFEEHEDALQHLWLAQLPNLNIIETLWSVLEQGEKQIRSIISQATRRRVEQYSTRDYSDLT